jgi:uncharacterized membrane protein YcaP (DUF421 family)
MFNMSMGVGEHIVRGVAVYAFLLLLLRFVGKNMSASSHPSISLCS